MTYDLIDFIFIVIIIFILSLIIPNDNIFYCNFVSKCNNSSFYCLSLWLELIVRSKFGFNFNSRINWCFIQFVTGPLYFWDPRNSRIRICSRLFDRFHNRLTFSVAKQLLISWIHIPMPRSSYWMCHGRISFRVNWFIM